MITVLRPSGIGTYQLRQYCHHVAKLAELDKEAIQVRPLSGWDIRSEWDRVNVTPGRLVAWLTPNFLPRRNFFQELDYLRTEECLVVTLRQYDALYQPGADLPALQPSGLCPFPLIFQLTGQNKIQLPPYSRLIRGHLPWLQKAARPTVVTLDQYFMGSGDCPVLRSALGDLLPDCWSGSTGVFGRVISGGQKTFEKDTVRQYWNERMESRELWLSSMSSSKPSASGGRAVSTRP
jgi:hypothetical protein